MPRKPEIGNVQLYPDRTLRVGDAHGYYLRFYCPLLRQRVRRYCGTRDRRQARRVWRECRERLLNGEYVASAGAITAVAALTQFQPIPSAPVVDEMTWSDASERYRSKHRRRNRKRSADDTTSRLAIAERIFDERRTQRNLPKGISVRECMTLEALEYLQEALLDGKASRFKSRSPNTVNSTMTAVMTFVRYCYKHGWIDKVPVLDKINADEVMKGRPITGEEFERMLKATPEIVGAGPSESWQFTLRVLWESTFRIQDAMEFSWDDPNYVHPIWPTRTGNHPTLIIPPAQKNGKAQEVPMLPGLAKLLLSVPKANRNGWVIDPQPIEFALKSQNNWFKPSADDLASLVPVYANTAIATACGVSDATVRNWMDKQGLTRTSPPRQYGKPIPEALVRRMRQRAEQKDFQVRQKVGRLSPHRVSEIISAIGEQTGIIVKSPRSDTEGRTKYASAHDLRRGGAERLINAGVSAETLQVVMRHRSFSTTEKFYGAKKKAQFAARELHEKLTSGDGSDALVGRLVGRSDDTPHLSPEELKKLKALLNSI